MASSFSVNKGIEEPASGDYINAWAAPVNANWTAIDAAFGGTTSISVTGISAPTTTLTLTQYRPPNIEFTGTLAANLNYQIPTGVGGMWSINNATTGSFTLTFSIAAGNSLVLTTGRTLIISNGTTIALAGVQNVTATEIGTLLYPPQPFEAGSTISAIQYAPLDPRRYATIADWSNAYSQVSASSDTDWPFYRGDHAQHPTQTNAIAGYKTFDDSECTGTVGWHCTALGAQALQFNGQSVTAGGTNTAVGYAALEHNIEGSGNTAVGPECFNALTGLNSSHNVGVGYRVGAVLVNGVQNNLFGFQVATNLIAGQNNHCYGESSIVNMTLGNGNHCFGYQSGWTSPLADYMHCFGYQALFNQTTAVISNISQAAGAVVTFTTVSAANPFTIGAQVGFETVAGMSQINGLMASVTAIGGTPGAWTVTVGINSSGFSAYTGSGNIFPIGNTAFGYRAGANIGLGSANILIGHQAGETNLVGDGCIFIGHQAGQQKNVGFGDIGIGYQALLRSIQGGNNVVIGQQAGNFIGFGPVNSTDHVVMGANAGQGIVGTFRNVCIGSTSGVNLNGNNNTSLGFNSGSPATAQTYTNTTNIGANAIPTGSNQVNIGDPNVTAIRAAVTSLTAYSDRRMKKNIEDLDIPDEFIDELQMRVFEWAIEGMASGKQVGVIAQEIDALQVKYGVEWLGLVDKSDPDKWCVNPGKLIFPLIQQVQKLRKRVAKLEAA